MSSIAPSIIFFAVAHFSFVQPTSTEFGAHKYIVPTTHQNSGAVTWSTFFSQGLPLSYGLPRRIYIDGAILVIHIEEASSVKHSSNRKNICARRRATRARFSLLRLNITDRRPCTNVLNLIRNHEITHDLDNLLLSYQTHSVLILPIVIMFVFLFFLNVYPFHFHGDRPHFCNQATNSLAILACPGTLGWTLSGKTSAQATQPVVSTRKMFLSPSAFL